MAYKIESPIAGHNGRSTFGPFAVEFKNGAAEIEDLNEGLKAYLKDRGYKVTGSARKSAAKKSDEEKSAAKKSDEEKSDEEKSDEEKEDLL